MDLLLVAATEAEITGLLAYLQQNWQVNEGVYSKGEKHIHICITGVGMLATTYNLALAFKKRYDFALQIGIAGTFDRNTTLGSLVFINREELGDMGAEDHYSFLDLFELNLLQPGTFPFTGKELISPTHPIHERFKLPAVKGITINTVAGERFTIEAREEKFCAEVESMEGAAFHYVCLQEKTPFAQVRSISNYIEPRDKSKWQIKEAVIALNKWAIDFIETL